MTTPVGNSYSKHRSPDNQLLIEADRDNSRVSIPLASQTINSIDGCGRQQSRSGGFGLGSVGSGKTDKRVVIEPGSIVFTISPNTAANEKESIEIKNNGITSLFFQSRSTNVDKLRPSPHSAFVNAFESAVVEIIYQSQKAPARKITERTERLTFEWIRLPKTVSKHSPIEKHAALLSNTRREQRYKATVPISFKLEEKCKISHEQVMQVRGAFVGTPGSMTLRGDFEHFDVVAELPVTNRSSANILWHLRGPNNVLLTPNPTEGVLQSCQNTKISITCRRFHVGNIGDISDNVIIEWTAAPVSIIQYSHKILLDAPKVFRVAIKIYYEYIPQKVNDIRKKEN